ncbi:hypothetical protein LE181_21390 [Streptomyces sp. SCA3-4]|uniref:hypothetical protein n=1 Tax=Streptomyces sichuanensis TaxID=2871810 RepID=UPI001CE32BC6|nr:hypothetical protein [Streptomyces sichuanensis]MCA6094714.1 hypothetical protein [Streptomyces sichuanensis]
MKMAELRQAVTEAMPDSLDAYYEELAEAADEMIRLRDVGPVDRFVATWRAKVMEQEAQGSSAEVSSGG